MGDKSIARCRAANWKHRRYCKEALAERRRVRGLLRTGKDLIAEFKDVLWGG